MRTHGFLLLLCCAHFAAAVSKSVLHTPSTHIIKPCITDKPRCGGYTNKKCPSLNQICVTDRKLSGCKDCGGVCVQATKASSFVTSAGCASPTNRRVITNARCGGFTGLKCATKEEVCAQDPYASPKCNDCFGYCVKPSADTFCGGIMGKRCSNGRVCVQSLNSTCDPTKGGRDCSGLCL